MSLTRCGQVARGRTCGRERIGRTHRVRLQVGDVLDVVTNTPRPRAAMSPYLDWIGERRFVLPDPTHSMQEAALGSAGSQPVAQRAGASATRLRVRCAGRIRRVRSSGREQSSQRDDSPSRPRPRSSLCPPPERFRSSGFHQRRVPVLFSAASSREHWGARRTVYQPADSSYKYPVESNAYGTTPKALHKVFGLRYSRPRSAAGGHPPRSRGTAQPVSPSGLRRIAPGRLASGLSFFCRPATPDPRQVAAHPGRC